MKVIQNLLPQSKYNLKCPYTMDWDRIVVHNTANDASARNEIAYMIRNDNSTSFHYAIDDKEIVQGIPENRNAFHAGDGGKGNGNRNGLGIEICYSKSGGQRFLDAEKLASKFIAKKLHEKGFGIDKVTKHQDYSGKYCPHRTLDMGWQRFLDMVQAELDKLTNGNVKVKVNIKGVIHELDGVGVYNSQGNLTQYVGIRELSEKLGYKVDWDNQNKVVIIK